MRKSSVSVTGAGTATAEAPLITPPGSDNEPEVDGWMFALCNQSAVSSEKLLADVVLKEHPILWETFKHRLKIGKQKIQVCSDPTLQNIDTFHENFILHTCKGHSFSFQKILKLCKSAYRFKSY